MFFLSWIGLKSHFVETQHTYAMQLGNNRVWDYAGDNYVHRLIQNKADGKLVEFNERPAVSLKFHLFFKPSKQLGSNLQRGCLNCIFVYCGLQVEQDEKLDSMQLEVSQYFKNNC